MKKLTKRVKAGGMLLDVPLNATHVSADSFGMIKAHTAKPINVGMESWLCAGFDDFVCYIDLEGADWRECCWYVGDQVDGESVERREWMARGVGVVASATETLDTGDALLNKVSSIIYQICVKVSDKIRAGEVE